MKRRYERTIGLPPRGENPEYMRMYREHRLDYKERNNRKRQSRNAAALRVAKNHPDEFAAVIAEEERKRGVND